MAAALLEPFGPRLPRLTYSFAAGWRRLASHGLGSGSSQPAGAPEAVANMERKAVEELQGLLQGSGPGGRSRSDRETAGSASQAQEVEGGGERDPEAKPEYGGPTGQEPTRFGDWERNGRCTDF